jgi:hypothetical protein
MTAEPPDQELARLRRLAVVEELLPALTGVLDVREVLSRVSDIAHRVLPHDAIILPAVAEHDCRGDDWEYEIVDDLQATPEADPSSAANGFRAELRVPVRLEGKPIAVLAIVSKAPAIYRPWPCALPHPTHRSHTSRQRWSRRRQGWHQRRATSGRSSALRWIAWPPWAAPPQLVVHA